MLACWQVDNVVDQNPNNWENPNCHNELSMKGSLGKSRVWAYILKASSNGAAKKLSFPQICPKMPRNGPKITQSVPNMTQNGPTRLKMAQELPKMTQIGPKMTRTFSAIFFDWKDGSANFFAFRICACFLLVVWFGLPKFDLEFVYLFLLLVCYKSERFSPLLV